jgi:hypothetical protein
MEGKRTGQGEERDGEIFISFFFLICLEDADTKIFGKIFGYFILREREG